MDAVLSKIEGATSGVELLCVLAELQKLMVGADGLEIARAGAKKLVLIAGVTGWRASSIANKIAQLIEKRIYPRENNTKRVCILHDYPSYSAVQCYRESVGRERNEFIRHLPATLPEARARAATQDLFATGDDPECLVCGAGRPTPASQPPALVW